MSDGVSEVPQPAPTAPLLAEEELLAQHGIQFPPNFVADISPQVTLDAEGRAAVEAMLDEIKRGES
jgi:hypothetical protein